MPEPGRLHILVLEPDGYSEEALDIYRELGVVQSGVGTEDDLSAILGECDVVVTRLGYTLDREFLGGAPRLRAIVTPTTGVDHVDLAAAAQRDIEVLSLRGETEFLRSIPATSELTWALLLALIRRIPEAFGSVLAGSWNRDAFRGHDLAGRRLGLLGVGRVGSRVATYGLAFGMEVHGYDPDPEARLEGVRYHAEPETMFRNTDILSIHVPLTQATEGLVGRAELERLPGAAVVINTSRGRVLRESALLDLLEGGHLAGAALDVVEGEVERGGAGPRLLEYARRNSNLLITPHLGGATFESMAATEVFMARRLAAWLGRGRA